MFRRLKSNTLLWTFLGLARSGDIHSQACQRTLFFVFFFLFSFLFSNTGNAQVPGESQKPGKVVTPDAMLRSKQDSTVQITKRPRRHRVSDSARYAYDSTYTLRKARVDSMRRGEILLQLSPNAITDVIHYQAVDSVAISLDRRQATLYKEGNIKYEDMELKADEVVVDFNGQTLKARGVPDSNGKYAGRPYFKQGDAEYYADTLTFNYSTKKGIISGVITQEGDGYLHGTRVKKVNDSVMFLSSGQYTTCNYAHPHFAINFSHSKLITGSMILTGPAYVSIRDVPTPLALPFAFFPLVKGRSSGLILPSYGWMNGRGYYLKDGGYYWAVNDNLDLAFLAELYTNLSWKGEVRSNYYKRYRYKGSVDVSYGSYRQGLKEDTAHYKIFSDFKIAWRHDQDAKANPRSRFSANVNLQSRNYNKTTTNSNDYFNSTTTSSVSYNTQLGSFLNLSAALNESFNSQTGLMNLKLPTMSLSSVTFYPFRGKKATGSYKWYQNISMSYVMNGGNNLSVQDTDLLKSSVLNKMQYGISHRIPVQSSVKVLRFLNWTNNLTYNERWHWSTIRKSIDSSTQALRIDTVRGFRANRDFSFSSSLSTRIYGMFNFRLPHFKVLRHVVNPSLNFSYRPDFGSSKIGFWQSYSDSTGYVHRYSIFEQSLYGGPADGRSGMLGVSVSNTLEAKFKPFTLKKSNASDTSQHISGTEQDEEELKKIVLIENLTIAMNYDLAKDSLNWSDLTVNGRTTLFKGLVLNYSGSFIPYEVDSAGRKHDQLLWNTRHRLFLRNNSTWSAQISWSLNNETFKHKDDDGRPVRRSNAELVTPILQSPYDFNPGLLVGNYVDFSMPWTLSVNYTLSYVSTYVASQYNFSSNVVQSLGMSGNVSLTDHWRISFSTGYDFVNKGISYTSLDIYRDLHCWEMRFNWVPFGYYRSWNFIVNIKASSLKDVKYQKRQNYQNNENYSLY